MKIKPNVTMRSVIVKILPLFCFSVCFSAILHAESKDSLSEKQWIQYAKAHSNSYFYNKKALNLAYENEYSYVVDSVSLLDIFSPLYHKGKLIRTGMKMPVLEGVQTYYYPSGKLLAEISYSNNQLHGEQKIYYESGQVFRLENYCESKRCGVWTSFYQDGKSIKKQYFKNGDSYADTLYYPGGKVAWYNSKTEKGTSTEFKEEIYDVGSHKSQTIEGTYYTSIVTKCFDLNGKEISEKEFWPLIFKMPEVNPNLILKKSESKSRSNTDLSDEFMISLFQNQRNAQLKSFFFASLRFYKGSRPEVVACDSAPRKLPSITGHGLFPNTGFYDTISCPVSGKILRTATIKKGRLNGPMKYYFLNGSLSCVVNFADDVMDGEFVSYHENGKIKQIGRFIKGIAVDTLFEYSENGALILEKIFKGTDAYTKNYYWADDHKLQRREVKAGEKLIVIIYSDSGVSEKEVEISENIQKYYFDKEGNEISKKKFERAFPGVIKDKVSRVRF